MDIARIIFYGLILLCCGVISQRSLVLAKFPDNPKPCKYQESECIIKIINYILDEKTEGDNSLNLIKLDPLRVPKISMKQGAESPVNVDLVFTDNDVIGLKNGIAYKINGFDKDIKGKNDIFLKFKHVSLVGDYKISGNVLILPITGNGKSNMTLVDLEVGLHWTGMPYEKDGETYMKTEKLNLTVNPGRLHFYFGNLFNGDKALGENMNLFLNENWREIYNEVRQNLIEAFAQIFQSIINNVFAKYPYNKYFME